MDFILLQLFFDTQQPACCVTHYSQLSSPPSVCLSVQPHVCLSACFRVGITSMRQQTAKCGVTGKQQAYQHSSFWKVNARANIDHFLRAHQSQTGGLNGRFLESNWYYFENDGSYGIVINIKSALVTNIKSNMDLSLVPIWMILNGPKQRNWSRYYIQLSPPPAPQLLQLRPTAMQRRCLHTKEGVDIHHAITRCFGHSRHSQAGQTNFYSQLLLFTIHNSQLLISAI